MKGFLNIPADGIKKRKFIICVILLAVLALCVIGAMAVTVADRNQPAKAAAAYQTLSAEVHTAPAAVDFDLLREKNPDVCAWVISEGTGIDYPVVQGENNEYYRRHLFSGETNRFGCLHVDAALSADFSGKNTVIHGCLQLDSIYKYARQDYYDLLPSLTICTPGRNYTVLLYAGISAGDIGAAVRTGFADSAEFLDYLSWLKENSVFRSNVSVSETDRIVTLCAADGNEGFLLVGKLT